MAGPGSIAFTGLNADDPDSIAFAALEDLPAGTIIILDDNEWNGTAFNTGEGTLTITLTTAVTAGTIIRIEASNTATPTISTGTVSRSGSFDISGTTESVYAYVGSSAAPTFLSAIGISGFTGATTTGLLTNTGLTLGVDSIDLGTVDAGADIGAYNGVRTGQLSFADYRALINNAANWVTQDAAGSQANDGTNPDAPFSAVPFVVSGGAETQSVVFNPVSVTQDEGNAGATIYTFTVTRTGGTTGILDFSGTIAAGTTDGADFTGGVAPTVFSGSIAAGATSGTFTVSVAGDSTIESNEAFQATLTTVNNQSGIAASIGANAVATGNYHQRRHAGPVDRQRLDDGRRFRDGHLYLHRQPRPRRADGRSHLRHRHRRRQRDGCGRRLCRQHPDQPDHRRGPDQLHVRRDRQRRCRRRAGRDFPRQRHQRPQRHGRRRPGHRNDRQQRSAADSGRLGRRLGDYRGRQRRQLRHLHGQPVLRADRTGHRRLHHRRRQRARRLRLCREQRPNQLRRGRNLQDRLHPRHRRHPPGERRGLHPDPLRSHRRNARRLERHRHDHGQ